MENETEVAEKSSENNESSNNENGGGNQPVLSSEDASTLQALGGLVNKEVLGQIAKEQAVAPVAEKKEEAAAENEGDDKKGDEKPKGEAKESKESPKPKGDEKPSVFGLNKKKNAAAPVVFEKVEDAIAHANTKFGMSLKDVKDFGKFFESSEKWRQDSQNLSKVQEERDQFQQIYEGLPPEMIQGIKDFYEKGDYSEALQNKPKFDYSKPVEKQDIKNLVNTYYPNKFADADFEDNDVPPALEIAIQASKDKYISEKAIRDSKLTQKTEEASAKLTAKKESIKSSVENLKREFPDMQDSAVKEVEKVLESGDLTSLFFKKDGSYDTSAAVRIAVAKFHKDLLQDAMGAAANDAETRVLEEVISRGADGKNPVKRNGGASEVPAHIQKQIDDLKNMGDKKKTF